MTWLKAHWKPLAAILALVLWTAWYTRPVGIYTVVPGIREADSMDFTLRELGENGADYPMKTLSQGDPEWNTALEAVEALRFRRPPWNPVLQFVPKHTITGRVTHEGDHHILFSMYKVGGGHMQMQFFIDEWMYFSSPLSSRNLTLWVKDSKQTGDALAEALRPLLDESESCFT